MTDAVMFQYNKFHNEKFNEEYLGSIGGFTPFQVACVKGIEETVKFYLLRDGLEKASQPLIGPLPSQKMRCIIKQHTFTILPETSPLTIAVLSGYTSITKVLLNAGADVKPVFGEKNLSLLMIASLAGYEEIAWLLIQAGVSVNQVDLDGKTALMHAAAEGTTNNVKILLDAGANPSISDTINKDTPLLVTASKKRKDVVQLLLDAGADPFVTNKDGDTPLHLAISANSPDLAEIFIVQFPELIIQTNNNGHTPSYLLSVKEKEIADEKRMRLCNYYNIKPSKKSSSCNFVSPSLSKEKKVISKEERDRLLVELLQDDDQGKNKNNKKNKKTVTSGKKDLTWTPPLTSNKTTNTNNEVVSTINEIVQVKKDVSVVETLFETLEIEDEDVLRPIPQIFEEEDYLCCTVCLAAEVSVLFLPCKHLNTCQDCSDKVNKCPLCDVEIVQRIGNISI